MVRRKFTVGCVLLQSLVRYAMVERERADGRTHH